jgi:hypothetical protein
VNWAKIATNAIHALLIFGSCYAAVNPQFAWAIPAFQACGAMFPPPDLLPGAKSVDPLTAK